jgi:oxygen-independent coproporphyrinogen-3 oxidase
MAGVYLSYPFCSQKCTYCNFASGVFPRELEAAYVTALESELAQTAWPWTPETVYLGGGTPGSCDPAELARLLGRIPGRPWREATIEAAPGMLEAARVDAWRAAGLNRVSLGVQSFVDAELRRTGRRHSAAAVCADVALLRAAGLAEINIDLIAGLPGQTAAGWDASLEAIERLAPPHVSVYLLEVDEDSRLGRELLLGGTRYGAAGVPGEGEIVEFYERAVERLAALGLRRYEISNFARPGHESAHNLKYWRLEPYRGFGADAHSFDGSERWQNVESPEEYMACHKERRSPVAAREPARLEEERFYVGLRLSEGVRPSPAERLRWREPIERALAAGLLSEAEGRVRLTDRGVLLSNEVFGEFLLP